MPTSTVAGTSSTLLSSSVACAPTPVEKPTNHACVVGPSQGDVETCHDWPIVCRVNWTAPTWVASGPSTSTWTGPTVFGPSTTQAWPPLIGSGVETPSGSSGIVEADVFATSTGSLPKAA